MTTPEVEAEEPSALGLIEAAQLQLFFELRTTYQGLKAIEQALEDASRGKTFLIRNDIVWGLAWSATNDLVVRAASWAESIYKPAGLIGTLRATHLQAFMIPKKANEEDADGDHGRRRAAFERLFPRGASDGTRNGVSLDFALIKDDFATSVETLRHDRHARARPYPRADARASRLELAEIDTVLTRMETVLNDLRYVCSDSQLHLHEHANLANAALTGAELADMVIMGGWREELLSDGRGVIRGRGAVYAALHDAHARHHAQLFNGDAVLEEVLSARERPSED